MENKKLLWIIFSAVLFAAIVVSVGLLLFWPSAALDKSAGAGTAKAEEEQFDPIEWVRDGREYPGLEEDEEDPSDSDFIIVYGESEDEEVEPDGTAAAEEEPDDKRDDKRTEETAKDGLSSETPETDKPVVEVVSPETSADKPARKPAAEKPRAAPEPAPVREKPAEVVRIREYWIQTGSYTSKMRAESVKDELAAKGIASLITTKGVDSTTYFRVRIGPYENKAEAEKFLGWLKGVQGFESSYVSQVYTTRRIN